MPSAGMAGGEIYICLSKMNIRGLCKGGYRDCYFSPHIFNYVKKTIDSVGDFFFHCIFANFFYFEII